MTLRTSFLALALALPVVAALGQEAAPEADPGLPSIRTENGRLVMHGARPASERRLQVRAWHRRWRRQIEPVHEAASLVHHVLNEEHPSMLPGACRILAKALVALDPKRLWPAPDYALHRHLQNHLEHLTRAATACLGGRRTAVGAELRRADRAHDQADLALRRWKE